jgi:LEA14-like dessication related protein
MGFLMKSDILKKAGALGLFVLLFATAGPLTPAAKKNITVSLSKKEVRDLSGSGLVLVFFVRVANSSSTEYALSRYDYRVVVQETDYFSLQTSMEEPIPVRAGRETLISLPVKITYSMLHEAVPGAKGNADIPCYVTGLLIFIDAKKKEQKVPFAFSGEFPAYSDPELLVMPVELKTLTIGGAELVFSFICRNPNSFELVLRDIAYRLRLGGREVSQEVIPGESPIQGGAERVFSLNLILDFFELGKEMFGVFERPSVPCELEWEARAASVWGDLKIGSLKQEDVPIVRQ